MCHLILNQKCIICMKEKVFFFQIIGLPRVPDVYKHINFVCKLFIRTERGYINCNIANDFKQFSFDDRLYIRVDIIII